MSDELNGKRIAFLMANEGVEQVELTEPLKAVREAGAEVDLLAPEEGEIQAFNHLDKGDTFAVDRAVGDADASAYDGLVLPGGVANPDQLRTKAERGRGLGHARLPGAQTGTWRSCNRSRRSSPARRSSRPRNTPLAAPPRS